MRVTINTQPKADEDIFKAGTLVINNSGQVILVATGKPYGEPENFFCGIILNSSLYPVGRYDNDWCKERFVKFIGNVLLEQE